MLIKTTSRPHRSLPGRQSGMTLLELLVAGVISLIAMSGMIILMANTLGTGTQTIKMTRLSQEMRTAMQIMTRELRRANYHSGYAACFGNINCRADLGITTRVLPVTINNAGTCFWFWYDRPQDPDGTQLAVTGEQVAAFRMRDNANGVGVIEMSVVQTGQPNCAGTDGTWQPITDPDVYDITGFSVTSGQFTTAVNSVASLVTDQIGIAMTARMASNASLPSWMQGNAAPEFSLQNFIRVRNDIPTP